MSKCVIDSSALIALLLGEPGSELVAKNLKNAVISSVNYAELVSVLSKRMDIDEITMLLEGIIEEVMPFSKEDSIRVGSLYNKTKQYGLSLGDRACIALGERLGSQVYTADKAWAKLSLDVKVVVVIR